VNDSREAVGPVLLSRSSGAIVIISARLPFVFVVCLYSVTSRHVTSRHHNQQPSLKFAASLGDVDYFEHSTTLAGHERKYGRRNLLAIQLEEKKETVFLNKVNSLVSFFFYRDSAFWYFDTQVQVQPYSKLNDTRLNKDVQLERLLLPRYQHFWTCGDVNQRYVRLSSVSIKF